MHVEFVGRCRLRYKRPKDRIITSISLTFKWTA